METPSKTSVLKTLVIDTATKACSVALFSGQQYLTGHHEIIGRGHAEKLIPLIEALPDKGRADRIAVNIGPGSFTGIRVGIAAAKALALAWEAECFGYGCLPLVAAMAKVEKDVDAVMTGGHGEYFVQCFNQHIGALDEARSMKPEEAFVHSQANIIAGDIADEFVKNLGHGEAHVHLPNARFWPLIAHLKPLPVRAFYGRPPDAKPAGSTKS